MQAWGRLPLLAPLRFPIFEISTSYRQFAEAVGGGLGFDPEPHIFGTELDLDRYPLGVGAGNRGAAPPGRGDPGGPTWVLLPRRRGHGVGRRCGAGERGLADTPDHGKMGGSLATGGEGQTPGSPGRAGTGPGHRRRCFAVNGVFRVKWHRLPACECGGTAHRFLLYNDYVSLIFPNCAWQ